MLQLRIRGPNIFFFWVFGVVVAVVVLVLKRLLADSFVAINQFREERHGWVVAWALSFSSGFGFTPLTHCLHTIAGVTVHFQCLHMEMEMEMEGRFFTTGGNAMLSRTNEEY